MKSTALVLAMAWLPVPTQAAGAPALQDLVAADTLPGEPGCAVALIRDGHAPEVAAAGLSDIGDERRIDGDTLFYAASVSKQFTALAVAQLAEAGRLSLDDDVRRHVPELPPQPTPVTLGMLLHHTSGVRDFLSLVRMAGLGSASSVSPETALSLLYRQASTNFEPGTRYLYSNGGYLLLAEVVARVSGEAFPDYVQRHVLAPLGMRRSRMLPVAGVVDNLAHGYARGAEGFQVRDTYPRFGGSGGLLTSANDMARYEADLASGDVVWTPAIRALLLAPGRLADGRIALHPKQRLGYAGGVLVGDRDGQRVIQHGGSAEAFRAYFARLPNAGIGVAVLCNRNDRDAQALGDRAIALHVAGFGVRPAPDGIAPGAYRAEELEATYSIRYEGERLVARIQPDRPGAAPVTLVFEREGDRYVGEHFSIARAADGRGLVLDASRATGVRAYPLDAD